MAHGRNKRPRRIKKLKAKMARALLVLLTTMLLSQACGPDEPAAPAARDTLNDPDISNRQTSADHRNASPTLVPIIELDRTHAVQPYLTVIPERPSEANTRGANGTTAHTRPTRGVTGTDPAQASPSPTTPDTKATPPEGAPTKQEPSLNGREQEDFLSRLDAGDRKCLPEQLSDDEQVISLMAQADEETRRATHQCMSNEGQFELYLLTTEDKALSRETHRCLWEGKRPLHEGPQPSNPGSGTTADARRLTSWIIEVYCKENDPAWKGVQIDGVPLQFVPQTDSIQCVVDAKGGTRRFAEWMLEDDQAVESVKRAFVTNDGCPSTD